ncbi:adenosylcobinamide-GDP ribazoletransferase [Methanohalophilus levihalophilus]|uniref:adenosylcobinamide-GDP ribazoletransferase n=1 Tax=Methanohalophilus levihalophilus TaxID=1431282 RepID=UPI001AE98BD3|nr:adenosylcobinamide-GDP ribazoletransferase [Methanohalophilus levihalophilus]MBP2030186.1 adenosylcobinamide-GDP ribazoletransferase [Methanohalophilus levihalophilus]
MSGFLLAVRTGFGFLSTIPVGITMEGLDELSKRSYLFVFTGAVLGILMGIFTIATEYVFPSDLSAALIVAFVYYLTGFNHLDGLSDFGDGFTAHGSLEKKIKALKDMSLGIGGVAFCVISLLILYAAIVSLQGVIQSTSSVGAMWLYLPLSIFVAEIGAKQAMVTISAFGEAIHEGLGSMVINVTTSGTFLIGVLIGGIACGLALGLVGLIAFAAAIVSAFWVLYVSNKHFTGINGDCIGTANEVGRIASLIATIVALNFAQASYGGVLWMLL